MNPLDRILSTNGGGPGGLRGLQGQAAPDILTRTAKQPDRALPLATPGAHSAEHPKAAEFARYFPGVAGSQINGRQGTGAPGLAGQISSAQLSGSIDVQAEIAVDSERKRLYNAALDFQGIFIGKMLKSMRGNLNPENDLLFGGNRQQIFEDMLYDEYSKAMSRSDGFDLADQMYQQLSAKLPPVPGSAAGDSPNILQKNPAAAGAVSTGSVRQAPANQSPNQNQTPGENRARDAYDSHRNRISTEQLWNENDWRP